MRWLTGEENEEGAIAVIVGIMMVTMIGFAAVAVDVAALFSERRELQNGADAAVLAVAQDCANGDTEAACDAGPQGDRLTTARTFAGSNATDGTAAVAESGGVVVDYSAARATVTATSWNDGEGFLRHWFAPLLGIDSTEVSATATAIWGPVEFGSIPTLPLTFSQCEYQELVPDPPPTADEPWTKANNGEPALIYFHLTDGEDGCNIYPPGFDLPGGFGWLNTDGGCEASVDDEGWVDDKTGNTPSTGCSAAWMAENVFQNVVAIPIFSNTNGLNGTNGEYYVDFYAAFYVTGYNFGGQYKEGMFVDPPCKGDDRCIEGWFAIDTYLDAVHDPDGADTGVRTVQLVPN